MVTIVMRSGDERESVKESIFMCLILQIFKKEWWKISTKYSETCLIQTCTREKNSDQTSPVVFAIEFKVCVFVWVTQYFQLHQFCCIVQDHGRGVSNFVILSQRSILLIIKLVDTYQMDRDNYNTPSMGCNNSAAYRKN